MKITTMSIIVMFMASSLVLPVGLSYAQTNVTAATPTFQTLTNPAGGNHTMSMPMANSPVSPSVTSPKVMAPLEEVKSGVAPKSVTCEQGFSLILKAEDGSAACVDSNTATILITRGWAAHS